MPTLGSSLSQAISALTDLINDLPDGAQRNKLIRQQKALAKELQALIDKNVQADTVAYRAATAALVDANNALVTARNDIARVAETIDAVAKVVETVAALAATL